MNKIAEVIKTAREKKGWGLREASRQSGVPVATLSKLESGKLENPTFTTLVLLRNALGIKDKAFFSLFE